MRIADCDVPSRKFAILGGLTWFMKRSTSSRYPKISGVWTCMLSGVMSRIGRSPFVASP